MESDISQSDILWRLWAWFEKNKKPVIYASSAVGAVALVTWFFVWRAHEKQVEASFTRFEEQEVQGVLLRPVGRYLAK
mgnify:CR=1 FL=1